MERGALLFDFKFKEFQKIVKPFWDVGAWASSTNSIQDSFFKKRIIRNLSQKFNFGKIVLILTKITL